MVEADDGTALGIYSKLKETFDDLHIEMTRIIGYSSDTTNVMFGQHNSVAQLLKSDFNFIQVVASSFLLCCIKTAKKCRRSLSGFVCSFSPLVKKARCL